LPGWRSSCSDRLLHCERVEANLTPACSTH
jgi:hypothetical protein